MVQLDLNETETKILAETIEAAVSDLRMEIADTDSMDYRDMLKARKAALTKVLEQIVDSG